MNQAEIPRLVPEAEPRPDQVLEATFAKEMIEKVLNELPLHYRELLKLKYYEGLSLKKIGTRFWPQLGFEEPMTIEIMRTIEIEALAAAREKLCQMGITGSGDLLPST